VKLESANLQHDLTEIPIEIRREGRRLVLRAPLGGELPSPAGTASVH
jgi:hypothetical protein